MCPEHATCFLCVLSMPLALCLCHDNATSFVYATRILFAWHLPGGCHSHRVCPANALSLRPTCTEDSICNQACFVSGYRGTVSVHIQV